MTCPERFQGQDLYVILGLTKSATDKDIKKAYRRAAIRFHPDKNRDNENATEEFQYLSKVHQILSNERTRKQYDLTGEVPTDENVGESFEDAYEHWRTMFPKFDMEDIKKFEKTYLNSDMEKEDIITAFESSKGDMIAVIESVPFSDADKVDHYVSVIKNANLHTKKGYKKNFTSSMKKLPKYFDDVENESEEAEEMKKNMGISTDISDEKNLKEMILKKNKSRESAMDALLNKYSKPVKEGKKKKNNNKRKHEDIPDEEFERIQASMKARKKK